MLFVLNKYLLCKNDILLKSKGIEYTEINVLMKRLEKFLYAFFWIILQNNLSTGSL